MRIILTIILSLCFFISSAQDQVQTMDLSFDNKTTEEIIAQIEAQTDYRFYFLKEWLGDERINGNYSNENIENILNDILRNSVLNFYLLDKKIILTKNHAIHDKVPEEDQIVVDDFGEEERAKPVFIVSEKTLIEEVEEETVPESIGKEETESKQTRFTISGLIKDVDNGKPLANVAVSVRGKGIGTSTDSNGYYKLELLPGSYTLVTNSLSTRSAQRKIVVYNNGEINFSLKEKFETLSEVLIEADADRNVKEVITGVTKIEVEGIKNIPLVLGERDIMKVAVTLPGISTTGEGSNGYNVRGGKTDQNLILLDEAAIYNPSHFFGVFSALNPFTTGNVTIYKGNIPAEYGGRLSSVFDITTKDANTEKFSGEASIGPVTSNLVVELPIVKNEAAIMLGGRSTYSNWILRSLDDESLKNSEASFFDIIAKYNHKLNDNNDIKVSAYYSKDKFSITSDSIYGYSNRMVSLGWNHKFNDNNKAALTLTNSEYQFDIEYDGDFNTDFGLDYSNNETELKLKFNYDPSERAGYTYGLASKLYNISPGTFKPLNGDSDIQRLDLDKEKGLETSLFVSNNFEVNEKLAFDAGLRYSVYAFLGEATQNIYQEGQPRNESTFLESEEFGNNEVIETYGGLEGRFSARYFLQEDLSIKASYNNTFQYIHTLSTNTTVSPTDTWKLSDKNIKPQRAQQLAVGVYKNFEDNMYELSIEAYGKTYDNILDYKVGAQLLLNESLETEVLQGEGRSYGLEFLIKKNRGIWNGWIGYTYSRTELKLDSEFAEERVNNGEYFPANYDKPHDFSAVLNYKMTQRFSFSGNFSYQTGRPITYPIGTYQFNGAEFTLYSDRNQFRIPDYYRLDVGFNYEGNHKIKKLAQSFWNLSIYNVLGRNNPYSVFFVTENGEIKAYQSSIFSVPIPTLTFNFKF